jgi:histidine ammonia-lyase
VLARLRKCAAAYDSDRAHAPDIAAVAQLIASGWFRALVDLPVGP